MNMNKIVMDLLDLSRLTMTLPGLSRFRREYAHDSRRYTTTFEIVVNRGQNRDSVTRQIYSVG